MYISLDKIVNGVAASLILGVLSIYIFSKVAFGSRWRGGFVCNDSYCLVTPEELIQSTSFLIGIIVYFLILFFLGYRFGWAGIGSLFKRIFGDS